MALTQRLTKKLKELDHDHREICNEISRINESLRAKQNEIVNLPLRIDQLNEEITKLEHDNMKVRGDLEVLEETQRQLVADQEALQARSNVRSELMLELLNDEERAQFKTKNNIQEATIQMKLETCNANIQEFKTKELSNGFKIDQVRGELGDEAMEKYKLWLQGSVDELKAEHKTKDILRQDASARLRECQRLLDDVNERRELEKYAKQHNLLDTPEAEETGKLVEVCETHRKKTRPVVISSSDEENTIEEPEESEECNDPNCECRQQPRKKKPVEGGGYTTTFRYNVKPQHPEGPDNGWTRRRW